MCGFTPTALKACGKTADRGLRLGSPSMAQRGATLESAAGNAVAFAR
eukprot:CAMPEP_0179890144 /NCGR_PEP_ID=MMETSP0982-20121206/32954_1 /TAXON_ID=483367 /ORGANISM="non described non described, Strain CCMP 2436" /LENGTH=46 /DNA_ID= /DNA_START= /DNA_END= /DNA_ORIENTATION=